MLGLYRDNGKENGNYYTLNLNPKPCNRGDFSTARTAEYWWLAGNAGTEKKMEATAWFRVQGIGYTWHFGMKEWKSKSCFGLGG